MGAPIGNRNAAGTRGSATNKMRAALKRGKRRRTMNKLLGKKEISNSYRFWLMTHKGRKN